MAWQVVWRLSPGSEWQPAKRKPQLPANLPTDLPTNLPSDSQFWGYTTENKAVFEGKPTAQEKPNDNVGTVCVAPLRRFLEMLLRSFHIRRGVLGHFLKKEDDVDVWVMLEDMLERKMGVEKEERGKGAKV